MRQVAPPVAAIVLALVIWQLVVVIFGIEEYLLPTPWNVAAGMVDQWERFLSESWATGQEVLLGFGLAVAIGVSLGIMMVVWSFFDRAVYPLLVTAQAVPKIAIAPILVIWFGFDLTPKVLTAFLVAIFPIVVNTAAGFKQTEQEMIYLAKSMGASVFTTFRTFRLPTALPSMFSGLKVAAALAVVGAVSGEFVAANRGLGYLLLSGSSTLDSVQVFGGVICLAAEGIVLYTVVEIVERVVSPRSRRQRRLNASQATA